MQKRHRELYYNNKIGSYKKQLEIEVQFCYDLEKDIRAMELEIVNPDLKNSEYIKKAKLLTIKRQGHTTSTNKIRILREKINENHNLLQALKDGT